MTSPISRIALRWLVLLCIAAWNVTGQTPVSAKEPEFQSLFNGQDLTGWDPQPGLWRVVDGCIEGGHPDGGRVEKSSFMPRQKDGQDAVFRNFHFRAEFWIETSNSGVQYRSYRLHPKTWSVGGYQYEVSSGLSTGFLYHQNHSGPNVSVGNSVINVAGQGGQVVGQVADQKWLYQQKFRVPTEWGRCDIVCRGNHIAHFVNGYPTAEFIDRDESTPDRKRRNDEGILALQIHSADAFRVRYRNLYLKEFPDRFGDAVRVFNDTDLTGWKKPYDAPEAWSATASTRDERGSLKSFGYLACRGAGTQPLVLDVNHGPAYVFRCQVTGGNWPAAKDAPLREVAGWNLLEITVRNGKPAVEFNGLRRDDLPAFVQNGKVALPSQVAAEYRNLVLIPIETAE